MSDKTETPVTDGAIAEALKDNPHPLCFGTDKERKNGWAYMASRIEQHARDLERQLTAKDERIAELEDRICSAVDAIDSVPGSFGVSQQTINTCMGIRKTLTTKETEK